MDVQSVLRRLARSWILNAVSGGIVGIMDMDIVSFEGNLTVSMPAGAPPSLNVRLIPEGPAAFRMRGGRTNGELVVFEADETGAVRRIKAGSYVLVHK